MVLLLFASLYTFAWIDSLHEAWKRQVFESWSRLIYDIYDVDLKM